MSKSLDQVVRPSPFEPEWERREATARKGILEVPVALRLPAGLAKSVWEGFVRWRKRDKVADLQQEAIKETLHGLVREWETHMRTRQADREGGKAILAEFRLSSRERDLLTNFLLFLCMRFLKSEATGERSGWYETD